jgi:two-component system OmpR family sensor kinase/two-component system sensor histidine kinase BaeS
MLKLFPEPVDPRALVDEAVAAFLARANEKGVRLTSDSTPDVTTIEADPIRVAEVLANLVSNAVRHTPTGGSVRVTAEGDGEGVRFSVTDTGAGIPADQLPHVFERFMKSADSGGAGLGLAIAKRLVEAHGGSIEARAADGAGTEIRFFLPVRPRTGT